MASSSPHLWESCPLQPPPQARQYGSHIGLWLLSYCPVLELRMRGGHQWISPCPGLLRRMHGILSNSVMIIPRFHNQKLWELIFPTLEPWAGEPGMGLGPPCSLGGTSAAETPLLIFKLPLGCMTSPFCVSTSTMRLDVAFSACPEL